MSTGTWNRVSGSVSKIELDLAKATKNDFRDLLSGVEYVYHLAAVKLHNEKNSNEEIIYNNVLATNAILEASARAKVNKVLFTSSVYAYGHLNLSILSESTTLDPKTLYGISKVAGEKMLEVAATRGNFDYAVARLFFVYGPNQFAEGGYKSVIVKNYERLLNGLPAIVNGSGNQILDYVYIDDCVRYLRSLMFSDFSGAVNVSSGEGTSILKLVEEMIRIVGSGEVVFCENDWTSGSMRIGKNEKIKSLFPQIKTTSLSDGLMETFLKIQSEVHFK